MHVVMRQRRCWLCRQPLGEADADWRLVEIDGEVHAVCDVHLDKCDVRIPLDMTEDDDG